MHRTLGVGRAALGAGLIFLCSSRPLKGCAERRATLAHKPRVVLNGRGDCSTAEKAVLANLILTSTPQHTCSTSLLCSRLVYESTRDGHVAGAEVRIRQHGREIMLRRTRQKVAPEGRRGTSALNLLPASKHSMGPACSLLARLAIAGHRPMDNSRA